MNIESTDHFAMNHDTPNSEIILMDPRNIAQARCPVVLLLDTSSSMSGAPIRSLQQGLLTFFEEVASDPFARLSVEACVVTYGDTVDTAMPFTPCIEIEAIEPPDLEAYGYTPMGGAISLGLHHIKERRAYYKRNGIPAYRPWMILMTDGMPNDPWEEPASMARRMSENGKLVFLGVGIGEGADMNTLSTILPAQWPPKRLADLRFKEFFQWLSDSLGDVSRSDPAEAQQGRPTSDWSF